MHEHAVWAFKKITHESSADPCEVSADSAKQYNFLGPVFCNHWLANYLKLSTSTDHWNLVPHALT